MSTEVSEIETTKEVTKEKKPTAPVAIDNSGSLKFNNQLELAAAASIAMRLPFVPESLRNEGLPAVMSAMLFCKQHKLPYSAMNEMGWVKGKLTQYGSLVTALAERHAEYGEHEAFFIDETGEQICAKNKNLKAEVWAHVRRVRKKASSVWNEYVFSIDEAKKAGLLGNQTWSKYTKDMLQHKTKARAIRDNYASALNGIHYHEDVAEALETQTRDGAGGTAVSALTAAISEEDNVNG